ncbi:MAG: HAMP domain-containing protein [Gemmatimonadetes bacterium]|nr:HAMP domain-containing protein [Gemmatimonadota bacterium]NIO32734.1 HAMP domain-containing protein [Gemmatimonadota bacterium]
MRTLSQFSLRSRFLLLVLLGAVVPLGAMGLWVARSARRSGEDMVRARLEESLSQTVEAAGRQWTLCQSVLLDLGDAPVVQSALRRGRPVTGVADAGSVRRLAGLWSAAAPYVYSVKIRDSRGGFLGQLPGDLDLEGGEPATLLGATLPHALTIRDRSSGERLGTLEVELRAESLLPPGAVTAGLGGSVLALFDARSGNPLLPLTIDPALFSTERFTWLGDEWLAVERRLGEPPVRFVMAGPVGPVTEPFEQAARRGTIGLLLVIALVFVLTTIFTRRLTRSLEHLSEAATSVSRGDLSRAAEEEGPPEVQGTARAFNSMTENLRRMLEKLSQQEAVAAVGEFAASLAHEVRNPLTSVSVDLQRTQRKLETEPEEARELIDRALGEIERLNKSVSDFLRIARSGRVSPDRVDLRMPVEAAIRAAAPGLQAKDVGFEQVMPSAPVWVRADQSALEQLVLNLLLNAIDALQGGRRAGLEVEVRDDRARVSVWDEGEGIPPEDLDKIFDPFFSTKDEGTGLGLSIARRIARAHGSELEAMSVPGEGTAFRFTLPIEAGESTPIVTPGKDAGNAS